MIRTMYSRAMRDYGVNAGKHFCPQQTRNPNPLRANEAIDRVHRNRLNPLLTVGIKPAAAPEASRETPRANVSTGAMVGYATHNQVLRSACFKQSFLCDQKSQQGELHFVIGAVDCQVVKSGSFD